MYLIIFNVFNFIIRINVFFRKTLTLRLFALYYSSKFKFKIQISNSNSNFKFKFKIQISNSNSKFKFQIQIQNSNFRFKFKFKTLMYLIFKIYNSKIINYLSDSYLLFSDLFCCTLISNSKIINIIIIINLKIFSNFTIPISLITFLIHIFFF